MIKYIFNLIDEQSSIKVYAYYTIRRTELHWQMYTERRTAAIWRFL